MSKNVFLLFFLVLCLCGCGSKTVETGYTPSAADSIAAQIDAQVLERGGVIYTPPKINTVFSSEEEDRYLMLARKLRSSVTVMATVPVNINNLKVSCPLARQMMEEVTRWMVQAGYRMQEIRKGKNIYFQQEQGEMLLTRDASQLANRKVASQAVLTGTYVVSPEQVRFSIRLVHTPTNDVIAMGTATVPITPDVHPLLIDEHTEAVKLMPSVQTRLQ